MYALTDQIRRSSRSVCANLAEAYGKMRYPAHFISKLTDCDAENAETGVWIEYSFRCGYIDRDLYDHLTYGNREVGKLLGYMIKNPERFSKFNQ